MKIAADFSQYLTPESMYQLLEILGKERGLKVNRFYKLNWKYIWFNSCGNIYNNISNSHLSLAGNEGTNQLVSFSEFLQMVKEFKPEEWNYFDIIKQIKISNLGNVKIGENIHISKDNFNGLIDFWKECQK